MQVKYRQYPHPVLSYFSDDFIDSAFQSTLICTPTKTAYKFVVKCKTSSQDLIDLIEKETACYALHIECPATRFRSNFTFFCEEFFFEIEEDLLFGKVQVCSFILAAKDILNYNSSDFHSDYNAMSFNVNKGDVLAVDRDRVFFAEKEIDPLKKLPSIFSVRPNNSPEAPPYDIETVGDKILIRLSQENFNRYRMLQSNQSLHTTLSTLLILPALVYIIDMLKISSSTHEEYEEKRWFRVLDKKLKDIGIDLNNLNTFNDSTIVIAQNLIADPLTRSLKVIEDYESYDEYESEELG